MSLSKKAVLKARCSGMAAPNATRSSKRLAIRSPSDPARSWANGSLHSALSSDDAVARARKAATISAVPKLPWPFDEVLICRRRRLSIFMIVRKHTREEGEKLCAFVHSTPASCESHAWLSWRHDDRYESPHTTFRTGSFSAHCSSSIAQCSVRRRPSTRCASRRQLCPRPRCP